MKILSYTQYVYLIIAALSIYKIIELWNDGTESYIFIGFAVVSLFMFFFRRHYGKKFEERKKQE
ncbi:hypothetical protein IMCC3317_23860 [Kordia antarctica]|uniref:Uncharacterized protein n=1 Tax=Kordia antarctica TaxID=1218801 RepID=A0A7L4ZK56_9FLAO|nr:hypothetical protein [Kordia antarctica]QHI37015.1 hypothetical protein IMCC3317_23860 [Kordia antarctica]